MFGRRADGKRVKGLDGLSRMTPLLMRSREGSTNYITITQDLQPIDDYIAKKKKEGIDYNYRDVVIATLVRVFKMRPRLNRFVLAGEFYQRNHIDVSMMVHKSLRTGDDETATKSRFTGYETIAEVKKVVDGEINRAISSSNNTDAVTDLLGKLPLWLLKIVVGGIRFFDHLGLLSDKFLRETSPMHCSFFVTDLKSLKMDYIYHHLYNFGNCGFFIAIGKEKIIPSIDENGNVVPKKVLEMGVSVEERFVDGLYFSRMIKTVKGVLSDIESLDSPLEEYQIQHLKTYPEIKAEKKAKKKAKKLAKKEAKKNKNRAA